MRAPTEIAPEDVMGFDAIMGSLQKCLRNVSWKGRPTWCWEHRAEVCERLSRQLLEGTYRPGQTVEFDIWRPKHRHVLAVGFIDRVVQRSYNDNLIYPLMSRLWLPENCACQTGKGTDYAIRLLHANMERAVREWGGYVGFKADIAGYYDNIRHEPPRRRFRAILPGWGAGFAVSTLDGQYGRDGAERGYKPGSQMVQIVGVDYLDPMDRAVAGLPGCLYLRYMDDFVALFPDERSCGHGLDAARDEAGRLGLALHPRKTHAVDERDPIELLGFDHRVGRLGEAYMLVLPEKVKQTRRDLAAMMRLVQAGRMTPAQASASWQCRRAHIAKGCSRRTLRSLDEYARSVGIVEEVAHDLCGEAGAAGQGGEGR